MVALSSDEDGIKHAVLFQIQRGNGKYTWYQLDRALSMHCAIGPRFRLAGKRITQIVAELVADGLVEELPGPNESQPAYALTERGEEVLLTIPRTW